MKQEHSKHQEGDDWIMCTCRKVFKKFKFEEHLKENV